MCPDFYVNRHRACYRTDGSAFYVCQNPTDAGEGVTMCDNATRRKGRKRGPGELRRRVGWTWGRMEKTPRAEREEKLTEPCFGVAVWWKKTGQERTGEVGGEEEGGGGT